MTTRLSVLSARVYNAKSRRPCGKHATVAIPALSETLEDRVLLSSWYVSTTGTSRAVGSFAAPFPTIQLAANVARPGDTVLIEGGTYHETVTPAHSGSQGAFITYEPYNNESVIIDGANSLGGWTKYSGDIYMTPQASNLGAGYNQVFFDSQMLNEARWPNSSANISTPAWATISRVSVGSTSSGLTTVTLYNSGLTMAANSLVGAIAHLSAGQQWVDQTALVIANTPTTSKGPGSITVKFVQETSYQIPAAGNRFYVVGALSLLDSAGEWFRNPTNNRLYVWDPKSDSPASHVVEAKARNFGFELSNLSYINIEHLSVTACTIDTNSYSTNNLLDYLNATYVSQATGLGSDQQDPWSAQYHPHTTGIILNGSSNALLNSTIAYSSGDGVFLGGSGNVVEDCIIHDVDYEAGDEAGITTLGTNEQVLHNTVYSAGRSGIVIRHTTASQISYNVVHDVGLQMTDLGGIYTWGTDGAGTDISHNVVYNVKTTGYGAAGVYLDNQSKNYTVDHNVTWNCDFGLKMNPACPDDLIVNNTFTGLQFSLESSGNEDMTGSRFYNNVFTQAAQFGPQAVRSYNLYSTTNPLFANVNLHDLQLLSNSPAVNAGLQISPYTSGYTGSRPDIGAYEFGLPGFSAGAPGATFTPPSSPPTGPITNPSTGSLNPQTSNARWGIINSGSGVRFTNQWGWLEFKGVNFGSGVKRLTANVSSLPSKSIRIQLRVGSVSAASIATLVIPAGAQPSVVSDIFTAAISSLSGLQNIFLVLIDPPAGGTIGTLSFS